MSDNLPIKYYRGEALMPPYSLDHYKKAKLVDIEEKTKKILRDVGFDYAGLTFSLDPQAEINLLALQNNIASLSYPQLYAASDGSQYSISDITDMANLIGTALVAGLTHHGTEDALIAAVQAATTEAEVDAVVDNR